MVDGGEQLGDGRTFAGGVAGDGGERALELGRGSDQRADELVSVEVVPPVHRHRCSVQSIRPVHHKHLASGEAGGGR
ncbi:MAG: hypothetical protein AB7Q42_12935 [Acidimicrobiia bacterium]